MIERGIELSAQYNSTGRTDSKAESSCRIYSKNSLYSLVIKIKNRKYKRLGEAELLTT